MGWSSEFVFLFVVAVHLVVFVVIGQQREGEGVGCRVVFPVNLVLAYRALDVFFFGRRVDIDFKLFLTVGAGDIVRLQHLNFSRFMFSRIWFASLTTRERSWRTGGASLGISSTPVFQAFRACADL